MRIKGFTLAELLISLAILGVIATFTIPKVLNGQQDQTKKAVFKETISAIYNAHYTAWLLNGSDNIPGTNTLMFNNMNYVKGCQSDATVQGCWPSGGGANDPAMELANGATIGDIDGYNTSFGPGTKVNTLTVDWNGAKGPNVLGDDLLSIWINVGTQTTTLIKPGIGPMRMDTAVDLNGIALWQWIWE